MLTQAELFVKCQARLGEGICWHPERGSLAWIDILGGRVFEYADGVSSEWECGQMIGAIAPTPHRGFIAALRDGLYRWNEAKGTFHLLVAAPYDPTRFRFNDGKVDRRGRFWVGTLSLEGAEQTSVLYCVESSGTVRRVVEGVSISNGIAWSPDGRSMYFIDSPTRAVRRFEFHEEDGTIGEGKVVVSFSRDDGLPDGCAIDSEGNLWVAHWGGGKVSQANPRTGRVLRTIKLPVRNVTSCTFGGHDLDRLFISTAKGDEGVDEPLAGSVFVFDPGTTGMPINLAAIAVACPSAVASVGGFNRESA
jgi:sugar lactone lactonase YvrE